ncbi:MAG: DUF3764 family protein [Opitutaceae bacterium]
MIRMICWNEVKDFDAWEANFDSHAEQHRAAGLTLEGLWRDIDDPNEVVFIFQVSDLEKARAFVTDPAELETGHRAGVTDGSIWFVR